MKKRHDIYWEFMTTAYEYGMLDNLTQSEIDELTAISENRTFRTLCKRERDLKSQYYDEGGWNRSLSYYQVMRPTVVLMATHLEKQLATCRNLRVRAIVGGYLRTMLDRMEYNNVYYQCRVVDLIKAYPKLSDDALAKLYVANKINMRHPSKEECDIELLTNVFKDTRRRMNSKVFAGNSAPITARESIYAARWLEIFERRR